jgi:NAD-dependent dihydropyrimidine dehydrogenase PreA subunit
MPREPDCIVCRACEEVCPVDAVLITDPGDVEAAMAGADAAAAPAITEAVATEGEASAEAAATVAAEPAIAAPVWEPKPDVWLQRMKESLADANLPDTGMAKAKPLFKEIRKETLDSLSRGKEFIALVHNDKCIGCTQCVYFCNFASIDMIGWELETRTDAFESKKALIVEDTCTGCTLCVFACPVEAITMEARA